MDSSTALNNLKSQEIIKSDAVIAFILARPAEKVRFILLGNNFKAIESGTLKRLMGTLMVFSENRSITTLRLVSDSENSNCSGAGFSRLNRSVKDFFTSVLFGVFIYIVLISLE